MIQRIQTLFLLLALVCMAIFYFIPFGSLELTTEAGISDVPMGLYGINFGEEHYSTIPMLVLVSFVVLTIIVSILLFKHRILQMRICVFNMILALGCTGLAFFLLYQASEKFATNYSTSILVVLPVVAAIFIALAIRGIAKDEALIRSIDRIR